jgi:calcineurin-like phosphoesterase family protein
MIYFTSDLHAFHKNIIKYDSLSFDNLEEYRKFIIEVWNSTIKPEDEVYMLGDIAAGGRNKWIDNFLDSLNGRKYLIRGNHDKDIMKTAYLRETKFEWVKDYYMLRYNKLFFPLFHYPIESWQNKSQGAIHLHGHSHGKFNDINERVPLRRMDVGFKACDFKIYSIEEIIKKFSDEKYDHKKRIKAANRSIYP